MDLKSSILMITFSVAISSLLIPSIAAIRDAPTPSPAGAAYPPVTFHIVSHSHDGAEALVADDDKKKPSKKGVLGAEINPALREICLATKTPNKCSDYLAPIAVGAGGTYQDPVSILNLEIELIYKKVEKAADEAEEIRKQGSTPADVAKGLAVCVEYYNKASDDLAKALLEFSEKKDAATVDNILTAAAEGIKKCDAGFTEKEEDESAAPMKKINVKIIEMAELGIEISDKWLKKAN
ncbi:hypothetical protein LINGRAHAP2_LOCUS28944 [Linum grandiflorum]